MAKVHHVFLVPGFFGFVNFGGLVYFAHVRELLGPLLSRRGVSVAIHHAPISPTASLRRRSAELAAFVARTAPDGDGPIHLVGHSSGGLDARLFTTPDVRLEDFPDVEPLAQRVRSVVSVSAPHYGTPLASFFSGIVGQKLLWMLSLATISVLRTGRLPMSVLVRVAAAMARSGLPGGKAAALLDQVYEELAGELPDDQRAPVTDFLRGTRSDQSLIPQLTPEGADIFNAAAADRPGVRYGCVVTRSRRPAIAARLAGGLGAYAQASYTVFEWLYALTSTFPSRAVPRLEVAQETALLRALDRPTGREDNDGIVPSLSQVWGEVVHAARADHLDVIGHFEDPRQVPPHHDWLMSGSGFDRAGFERLWDDVAAFIAETAR